MGQKRAAEEYTVNQLRLRSFNPTTMRDSGITVFVASKGSGKSTCMASFLHAKRHLPAGVVYSATEESNDFFGQMVPPAYCFSEFDIEALTKIYEHQKTKVSQYKRPRSEEDRRLISDEDLEKRDGFWAVYERDPHIFLVIEDMMYDKSKFKLPIVRDLFMNGRHRKVFAMITVQYIMDMPSELRSQVDYWVLFKEDKPVNRQKLYEHVAGGKCKSPKVFNHIMDVCTRDYGCVVIDARNNSGRIEDAVYHYRAVKRPPFRIGCRAYWRYGQKNARAKGFVELTAAELEAKRRMAGGSTTVVGRKRGAAADEDGGDTVGVDIASSGTSIKRPRTATADVANDLPYFDVVQDTGGDGRPTLDIVLE